MGAGVPQETINRYVRKQVRAAFMEFKGERIDGVSATKNASGVYEGIAWSLRYRVSRASNGETFVSPIITLDGVPTEAGSLKTALSRKLMERVNESV